MNIREVSIEHLDLIRFGFKTYILSKTNIQNLGFLLPFVGSYPLECHNYMGNEFHLWAQKVTDVLINDMTKKPYNFILAF